MLTYTELGFSSEQSLQAALQIARGNEGFIFYSKAQIVAGSYLITQANRKFTTNLYLVKGYGSVAEQIALSLAKDRHRVRHALKEPHSENGRWLSAWLEQRVVDVLATEEYLLKSENIAEINALREMSCAIIIRVFDLSDATRQTFGRDQEL
ncbi:MAG TPA: hypothetical protein VEA59_04040 [Patescibacteria group bacterium]|nr:hypothetical protein [Patescibacteria group bacterium]